jgi:hypothetical protein
VAVGEADGRRAEPGRRRRKVRRPQVGAAGFFFGSTSQFTDCQNVVILFTDFQNVVNLFTNFQIVIILFTDCQNVNFPIYLLSKCQLPNLPTVKMSTSQFTDCQNVDFLIFQL